MFATYMSRWQLVADGEPITTPSSTLLPVRRHGAPAMLKIARDEDERRGNALMGWWDGVGAARVLARDDTAIVLERAMGAASVADMARDGRDDQACQILCEVAGRLHLPRPGQPPELTPLETWFRALAPAAATHGCILVRCHRTACDLLAEPQECCILHGDLHHGNVLDFGPRGWRALDPKGLRGERGFDFANIFANPDLADPSRPVATEPARFARRVDVVAEAAGLERRRLLSWVLAFSGLSAAWFLIDDDPLAAIPLRIAERAAAELDR